jgi:hypothetical protein
MPHRHPSPLIHNRDRRVAMRPTFFPAVFVFFHLARAKAASFARGASGRT